MTAQVATEKGLREFPVLRRLAELRSSGERAFWTLHDANDDIVLVQGLRTWPDGWADVLGILDATDSQALRCQAENGVVWRCTGSLDEVIDGLMELPAPDEPNAPRLVIGHAPTLWTPGARVSPGM